VPITTDIVRSNPLRRGVLHTTLCDKFCQSLAADRWFSLCTLVSLTNKTDRHDITEILLKVALNTITLLITTINTTWRSIWSKAIITIQIDLVFYLSLIFQYYFSYDACSSGNTWVHMENHIGSVMVSLLASSSISRGFEPRSDWTKDCNIGICCFSAKLTTLRSKNKGWLGRNQDHVSKWGDMSTRGQLLLSASTIQMQY
jgi:hypothetical protein